MVSRGSFSRRRFLAGTAVLAATPALVSIPSVGATSTGVRIVNSGGLRVRSGAGTGYSVLASLAVGTAVNYLGSGGWANGYEWAKIEVRSNGLVGYVAAQYLSSPIAGEFPIGSMVHADAAGSGGNLRNGPGTGYGVIAVIRNGTTGTVVDGPSQANGYTWYKVNFGDTQGWMASVVLAAGGGSDRSRVRVADGPLNVRRQPGTGSTIIASVATGATGYTTTDMPQDANGYTWVNVQFDSGTRGWVASAFLAWI